MRISTLSIAVASAFALTAVAHTQQAAAQPSPESVLPPVQQIDDVPPFAPQNLILADIPQPTGPSESLFNGADLSAFTPWLGKPGGGMIFPGSTETPLGRTGMGEVFRVVQVDGAPAIYISGLIWGALNTVRSYGNYHLSFEYKFGAQWSPQTPPNSGVLYHSYGPEGGFVGTWMNSIEFEIAGPDTGMLLPVGTELRMDIAVGEGNGTGMMGGQDLYYMHGGKLANLRMPTQVREAREVEHPLGQWNRLDLYVHGNGSVHVVNGVPLMAVSNINLMGEDGMSRPLGEGRIQIQSEGTEIFLRDVRIEPIGALPRVVPAG